LNVTRHQDDETDNVKTYKRPRRSPPNQRRSLQTTNQGESVRNLVVLIQWQDHANRTLPSPQDIDILMNHDGPHPLCPTGSVRDVFLKNSKGALRLESHVTDWVVVNNTEAYFSHGVSGRSKRIWGAVEYALQYLDSNDIIDFNYFDQNEDGKIDLITFLHSGYGAEWGGTDGYGQFYEERIWSHKWALHENPFVSKSGVQVREYHISPSLWGRSGFGIGRIGVIAHETGHFLGAPDLYDIDGGGRGLGCFDFMANSWGFDGSQYFPSYMSPWTKLLMGWAIPYLPSPGINQIQAAHIQNATLPQLYVITEGFPAGEFLLIENRQRKEYDQIMPQSGLLIWHIDHGTSGVRAFVESLKREGHPGQDNWPQNGNHYGVALAQADGHYHLERGLGIGDSGDFFHAAGVKELIPCQNPSSCQYPNTDSYQGGSITQTDVYITDVSVSGDVMTFHYQVGRPETDEPSSAPSQVPSLQPTSTSSAMPSEGPSGPPSPSPTDFCFSSHQLCYSDSQCCSGKCKPREKRFFGRCK